MYKLVKDLHIVKCECCGDISIVPTETLVKMMYDGILDTEDDCFDEHDDCCDGDCDNCIH